MSVFTFFTLLLNGVAATALAPLVTRSVLSLALASTAFVVAGGVCWLRHLAVARCDRTPVLRT